MKRLGLALLLALALSACAKRGKLRTFTAPPPRPTPEALAQATPSPTPEPTPITIEVAKGDNLWNLSRKHLGRGARYTELVSLNAIKDPWWIFPRQQLRIPTGTEVVPVAAGGSRISDNAAARPAASPKPDPKLPPEEWPKRKNTAFALGERLVFAVQYFNVTAGFATLSIPEVVTISARPTFHIVAEAKTHPFFETFFKVRDRIETFIDTEALISWRYEKHIKEGGYQADAFYLFDQRAKKMHEPDKGKTVDVAADTQDVLSCFYWARTLPLEVGQSYFVKVAADDMKNYELKVDVLRREKASTLAGDFDTLVIQPHLKFEGVFQQKGEVFIWITDDERRIPVKIRSKIVIGSININLQDADWVQPANP